ncbi:MAG: HAMP domain-containing protein [Piscinibacter sp.]|nr:HAMP domain-containing protein [Piscinibacter sp.]
MISRLTIGKRLIIGFATLSFMILAVATTAVIDLSASNGRLRSYVQGIQARAARAAHMHLAIERRAIAARNMVVFEDRGAIEREAEAAARAHAQAQAELAELQRLAGPRSDANDEARRLIAHIAEVEKRYEPVALAIVDLARNGRKAEAAAKLAQDCAPLLAELDRAAAAYEEYTQARGQAIVAASLEHAEQQRLWMIGIGAAALLLALATAVAIHRSIVRPIGEAVQVAQAVAAGDLTLGAAPQGRDELATLLTALGSMTSSLDRIVRKVREGSDSIATGTREIAMGNSDLSRRTELQASALQETAATMDELGATVRNNADHARRANGLAIDAREVAVRGGDAVKQVIDTMGEINTSSQRILDITGVIDGIAFQTNILALNAAVEAARAGEQGRGFSIVAHEVRTLAHRSAEAARDIKRLITASAEQVQAGTARVQDAGTTMQEVIDAIRRVDTVVAEIKTASAEQSTGVSQVGEAMAQIDEATQQNAALVEQSAAAAEQLRRQAAELAQLVSVFRVGAEVPA